MKDAHTIETFVGLLDHQADLIAELANQEAALQEVVAARDWRRLEELLPRMTEVSEAISSVEAQRNDMFHEIAASVGGEVSFARILQRLPEHVRSELSRAYRRLKVSVLALQSRTAGMDSYLRSTIATTRGILKELYPEHTAHGYSRDGQGRFGTAPAVMVDHAL